MADVIPTFQQTGLVKNIGVVRPDSYQFGGGEARGLDELAAGAGRVAQVSGDIAEQEGVAQSIQAGTKAAAALQRDANGNLEPLPWAPDNSPENIVYNRALQAGAVAGFENDQRTAAATYRGQAPYDAQGFAKLWQGHTEGVLAGLDPRFQPIAAQHLAQIGTETQNGILDAQRQRGFQLSQNDWQTALVQKEADLDSLAASGQIGHPAYSQTSNDYIQLLKSGVASNFIGQGAADVRRAQVADKGEAYGISAQALGAYHAAGGGAAGEEAALGVLKRIDDPKLQITPEQRLHIESMTRSRMIEEQAIKNQVADQAWNQQAQPLIEKMKVGIEVPPGSVDQAARTLVSAGRPDLAQKIQGVAQLQQQITTIGKLPLDQQQTTLTGLQAKMADGSATVEEGELAHQIPGMMQAKAKALIADPFGYGSQVHSDLTGPVQPIDWNALPQVMAPVLQQRAMQAQKLSAYEGVFVPPLTTSELQTLSASLIADPANAPARLATVQAAAGAAWPSIWRGLSTLGQLPPGYQAVGAIADNDPSQAALLARAYAQDRQIDAKGVPKENPKLLTDLLPKGSQGNVDQAIADVPGTPVGQFLGSLRDSGASAQYLTSTLGAIRTLAYANVIYGGASPADAAKKAISAFASKYEFLPGGARVPREQADAVTANAAQTIATLKPDAIMIPALYGQPGQPKPEEYIGALKAAPSWITSPQANALWLMDPEGRLVRQANGKPVAVPFDAPAPPTAEPYYPPGTGG